MSLYDHFSEQEIALLRARAERIAGQQKQNQEGSVISVLVIRTGGETYGLPMDALTAVYEGHSVVPLPTVPAFVAGIANVRGRILPVLDLAALMGVTSDTRKQALVVVTNSETSVAFCAESVGEAAAVNIHTLQPVPGALNPARSAYLRGILPGGLALLNVDAILNDPALIVDETVA